MKYLSNYTEDAIQAATKEYGAFFAFSYSQFVEQRKPDIEYIALDTGLICPKENVNKLISALEKAHIEGIHMDVAENGATKIIEREYFNHETQITLNLQTLKDVIFQYEELYPELFTEELLMNTCRNCFELACEKGWF